MWECTYFPKEHLQFDWSSQIAQCKGKGLYANIKIFLADELNAYMYKSHLQLLLGKYYCQLPLNVGSFRLLRHLQKVRILTATEYICRQVKIQQDILYYNLRSVTSSIQNEEQLQLVLIEFLESEPELLCNLFISALYGKLAIILFYSILIVFLL